MDLDVVPMQYNTYFGPTGRRASFGAITFEKEICFSGGGPPLG